jgi:hypothetical protein
MDDWRRERMSDLINAFDFEYVRGDLPSSTALFDTYVTSYTQPDHSIPALPQPRMPMTDI